MIIMSVSHSFIVDLQKELSNIYSGSIPSFVHDHFKSKGISKLKNTEAKDGKSKIIADPNFINNPTGYCLLVYKNEAAYLGNVKDFKKHGHGVKLYPAKHNLYYIGNYEKEKKSGDGNLYKVKDNFQIYSGQWWNDMKHGKGVYNNDAGTYSGDFKEDFFDGHGTMTWKNGDVYKG